MATKVKLHTKPITGNRLALFLDFYPPIQHPKKDKLTRREFLNLYLFDEVVVEHQVTTDSDGKVKRKFVTTLGKNGHPLRNKLNPLEKTHNHETWVLAEQIRQKRENQLNKPEIYSAYEREQLRIKEKLDGSFLEYFKGICKRKAEPNSERWETVYKYLERFSGGMIRFSDLNDKFCNDFGEYLSHTHMLRSKKRKLAVNTAAGYFSYFKTALKEAYKDDILQKDLNIRIKCLKTVDTHRNFLTLDELNKLVQTDCDRPILKNAALFSALTGLRFGDIARLRWENLQYIPDSGYFLRFTQHKTNGAEMMPISDQASFLMGRRGPAKDKVFSGLAYTAYINKYLEKWVRQAGITRKITFHCFRHTFATLLLSRGTDIMTVSKMLGHRSVKTTQVYAKVMDQAKREASEKIRLKF